MVSQAAGAQVEVAAGGDAAALIIQRALDGHRQRPAAGLPHCSLPVGQGGSRNREAAGLRIGIIQYQPPAVQAQAALGTKRPRRSVHLAGGDRQLAVPQMQ